MRAKHGDQSRYLIPRQKYLFHKLVELLNKDPSESLRTETERLVVERNIFQAGKETTQLVMLANTLLNRLAWYASWQEAHGDGWVETLKRRSEEIRHIYAMKAMTTKSIRGSSKLSSFVQEQMRDYTDRTLSKEPKGSQAREPGRPHHEALPA